MKNKIVFITGASSGIGEACAKQFAKAGANLILCARRNDLLEKLADALINEFSIKIYLFQLDVRKKEDVKKQMNALPPPWKNIDILINNAGLAAGFDFLQEGDIEDWETMIDTNIKGLLYITRAVLPGMIERNTGHVINLGSIAGHHVYPRGTVYCATKAAVNSITQGLRMDLLGTAIRVTTIDPGAVETNFSHVRFKGNAERAKAIYSGYKPLCADDIADAVVYAASRPAHVNITEMIIMPTAQAAVSMFHRKEDFL